MTNHLPQWQLLIILLGISFLCLVSSIEAPSTRIRIFLNPQLFRFGYGFRSHVSSETGIRSRNFVNSLSVVELFEYAINPHTPKSCGRQSQFFLSNDVLRSSPVLCRDCTFQEDNLVARFSQGKAWCKFRALCYTCSVNNIPRGVLGTRVNPDTCGRGKFSDFWIWKEKVADLKKAGYAHNIIYISILASGDQYKFIQIENIIHWSITRSLFVLKF